MFLIWLDTREAFHLLHLFVFTELDPVVLIEIMCGDKAIWAVVL